MGALGKGVWVRGGCRAVGSPRLRVLCAAWHRQLKNRPASWRRLRLMPGGAEAGGLAPLAEPLLASRDGEMDVLPASNIRSAAGAGVLREQGSRLNSLQLDSQSDVAVEIVGGEEHAAGGASVSSDARGCCSSRWGLLTFDMAAAAARALPIALLNLTHAYSFAQVQLRRGPRTPPGEGGAHAPDDACAQHPEARTRRQAPVRAWACFREEATATRCGASPVSRGHRWRGDAQRSPSLPPLPPSVAGAARVCRHAT
eukprot:scaffold6024_cov101-Isochrysis_galbana.AAC.1